jgi:hypothetical protein
MSTERFKDYAHRSPAELAGMLIELEDAREHDREKLAQMRKSGELAAQAMESLAMATPDRTLRAVAQNAARKFRLAWGLK